MANMSEKRKNELLGDMLTLILENGGTCEHLYHELCDNLRMSVDELHDCSIDSLDDFIEEIRIKAVRDWGNIRDLFCLHTRENSKKPESERTVLEARVIIAACSFTQTYCPESRTYMFHSDNKAFDVTMNGTSIYGTSLDLSDANVRLDAYIMNGREDKWIMDGCFVMDKGLSLSEREFCMKHDIRVVHELDRNYPQWPSPFSAMYIG